MARLEQTTGLLNEVQMVAQQQVQAMAEDRDEQVASVKAEVVEVGQKCQETVREVEARLACKDAALAVVQAQRREVVEMWGGAVKAVVGMVHAGEIEGVETGQVDLGSGGNDAIGEEDLGSVLRAGMVVTEWLTRACDQVAAAYRDVRGQLHAMTESANANNTRISQLESELAQTADQLTSTRAELATLQSADSELTGSLRTQLANVTADRDSLHAELTVLRHQLAATANERDHVSTDLARVQAELADAKSNQARMAGDLTMAKKLLEAERKYRRDHSAVQAELADVQSQLAQVQAERAADQQQLADEQSRRKAETGQLMAAVVEAQREVAQLREKLALVQGGDGLLRSASRPASPAAASVPTTPMAVPPPLSTATASAKGRYAGGLGGLDSGDSHGMTTSSPADSLSSTIARLQQRLNRSGNGELGSVATASPTSVRAASI
ncbi:hypothetical protein BCR44DRAFT_1425826 [Catenaria anguillulae PL171]|uniref:Uncharacterized protein n=1 Tax=Catenaria anguillulae PL171 TaxID=765915 RepID=A0A1Y2HZ48_9FUNG|nr:hypothetical protein BCR44DRAFT_1425826 [Catenaria anguillulae PL171]